MGEKQFAHDKSQYERPNFPYRCGRGVLWQKPCNLGPNLDGSCGGVSECTPVLKGSRWQCKRPKSAGGTCEDGPTPYGECGLKHPPCAPKSTLRVIRGRLSLLVAIFIVALIGVLQAFYPINNRIIKSSDLNPISRVHQKFVQDSGCSTCHAAHNKGPGAWVTALVSKTDLSSNCVNCHTFAGPSFKAHNGGIKKDGDYQETHCQMCHREHKGEMFKTKVLTGKQCNFCHKAKFESFSRGHPEFREKYPYLKRNSINFNHVKHFNKYFENAKSNGKGPQTCIGCHNVTAADRAVRSFGFDVVCAECHARKIIKNKLNLINLPLIETPFSEKDQDQIFKSCSGSVMTSIDELKADKKINESRQKKMYEKIRKMRKNIKKIMGSQEPVSDSDSMVITAYLLNLQAIDDPEENDTPIKALIMKMAMMKKPEKKEGDEGGESVVELKNPIAELIEDRLKELTNERLVKLVKNRLEKMTRERLVELIKDRLEKMTKERLVELTDDYLPKKDVAPGEKVGKEALEEYIKKHLKEFNHDRLVELIKDYFLKKDITKNLLAGLHPEVLKRAACAWALNQKYEPPVITEYGGWSSGPLTVSYTPSGHADPVAKSWVELTLAVISGEKEQQKSVLAQEMYDEMVDRDSGVGSCTKCHAVTAKRSAEGEEQLFVEWKITWPELNPFVFYSHKNHIDMLGVNDSCKHCHVMDNKAKYKESFKTEDPAKFESNFRGIQRNQCVTCHSENQVAQECQLCHIYHIKPGFKKTMMTVAKTQPSINN